MKVKEENYNKIIDNRYKQYSILESYTNQVKRDLKKLKVKNKFTSILSGSIIVVLGTLLVIK